MPDALESLRALIDRRAIDVLVSDLDGVLRRFDPHLWAELDAQLGLGRGAARGAVLGSPFLREVTHGRATFAQWRERAVATLVEQGADEDAARAAVDRWARTPARVGEDVAGLLRTARAASIAVFVFTNGTDRVPAEIAELGLDEFTGADGRHLLNSAELGVAKPAVEAFAAAHRRIEDVLGRRVEPERVGFVDDSRSHVDGAREFGWVGVGWPVR